MLTPLLNTDIVNQWAIQQPAVPWGAVMLENMKSILWQIIMTYYSGEEGIRMDICLQGVQAHKISNTSRLAFTALWTYSS